MVAACKDVLTGELVPRAMLHASPHVYFFLGRHAILSYR